MTIPDSVTSMVGSIFNYCNSLVELTIPFVGTQRGNTGANTALFGIIFGASSYTGGTAVEQRWEKSSTVTYYIPSSLRTVHVTDETVLAYGAFYKCSMLTTITLPNTLTTINGRAFQYCTSLTSMTIPDSVTLINGFALGCCRSLVSVTVPFVGRERGGSGATYTLFGWLFGTDSATGCVEVV